MAINIYKLVCKCIYNGIIKNNHNYTVQIIIFFFLKRLKFYRKLTSFLNYIYIYDLKVNWI